MELQLLLEKSSRDHSHLCPRQILGVQMGLVGMKALGFDTPPEKKRLLVITETDGCFVDGLSATTNCTVGHRTLRVEDYGKTAATFVDTQTGRAVRFAPALDIRQNAYVYAPNETVEKPLVLKMFKKTSHNRLKNSQNIAKMFFGTPKTRCFSAFLSHFSKIIFERRLIRQFQRAASLLRTDDRLSSHAR